MMITLVSLFLNNIAEYVWHKQAIGEEEKKRYGHTACVWENKIVFVGGSKMYSNDAKRRECLNDILIFNPYNLEWSKVHAEGSAFEPRRYHCTCIIGKHLLVYGGINWQQNYLADVMAINLAAQPDPLNENINPFRWIPIRFKGEKPGPLAYHSCQLILHPDRYRYGGQLSLTSLPEIRGKNSRVLILMHLLFRFYKKGFISLVEEMKKGLTTKCTFLKLVTNYVNGRI